MRTKFLPLVLITAFIFLGLMGLGLQKASGEDDVQRPVIVTTTSQIADIVSNIAGDHIKVVSLMGPGVDPHLYRPARSDMIKLKRADMIFYNGLHLEAQMNEVFALLSQEKPVIAVSDVLKAEQLIEDTEKAVDPHVWMDVENWMSVSRHIATALSDHHPEHSKYFTENADAYSAKLERLDIAIHKAIGSIPVHSRILITAHDAFGYLGQAYGLDVLGVQGLSTESEAGLKHVENLVDKIVEHKIPAVFGETSVQDRTLRAVMEGVQAQGQDIQFGGHLFSDAMGSTGHYTGTYIGMMSHNVSVITKALGGQDYLFDLKNQLSAVLVDE